MWLRARARARACVCVCVCVSAFVCLVYSVCVRFVRSRVMPIGCAAPICTAVGQDQSNEPSRAVQPSHSLRER